MFIQEWVLLKLRTARSRNVTVKQEWFINTTNAKICSQAGVKPKRAKNIVERIAKTQQYHHNVGEHDNNQKCWRIFKNNLKALDCCL